MVVVLVAGLKRRSALYRIGKPEHRGGHFLFLLRYLIGHSKIRRERWPGTAHMLLFWGFFITLILLLLSQFALIFPSHLAGTLSLIRDLAGMAMLTGTLYFLFRRIFNRGPGKPERSLLPLIILLAILITGFLAEGGRLAILQTEPFWWSPAGHIISLICPQSPIFMKLMIRLHFFAVVIFFSLIPFTFMKHMGSTLLNVFYRDQESLMERAPEPLGRSFLGTRTVKDFTWKHLLDADACVSCGRCEKSCPAFLSEKPLSPQKIVRNIFAQMKESARIGTLQKGQFDPLLSRDIEKDEVWSCTTCGACNFECPAELDIMGKIIRLRQDHVDRGDSPTLCHTTLESIATRGNPWQMPQSDRMNWAEGINLKTWPAEDKTDWLYWVGCTGSYVNLAQDISRAVLKLLGQGGIRHALLGKEERCCGEPARRMGEEGLFQKICRENISLFDGYGIKKIITHCPHCYHTFKNEYPLLGGKYEVYHHSQLPALLGFENKLSVHGESKYASIFFQDPCYLARYNGIYKEPRKVIRNLLSGTLVNIESWDRSFCCGGGGGHMWLDIQAGRRIETVRLEQIQRLEPEVIATACPFCKIMLDSALSSLGDADRFQVKDISELLLESC